MSLYTGTGLHVYPSVGRELPCPPRRREGNRVFRRQESTIRRLPHHGSLAGTIRTYVC